MSNNLKNCAGCAVLLPENEKMEQDIKRLKCQLQMEMELRITAEYAQNKQEILTVEYIDKLNKRLGELIEAREKVVKYQEQLLEATTEAHFWEDKYNKLKDTQ